MTEASVLRATGEALGLEGVLIDLALEATEGYGAQLRQALVQAQHAAVLYKERQIDETIWRDTMSDIVIWCENCAKKNGVAGLENLAWLQHHFALELFRLGRLQFQMAIFVWPEWLTQSDRLLTGQNVLFLHIPQGAPLSPSAVDDSLSRVGPFFRRYWPAFADVPIVCESWLLYPGNAAFMRSDSNILRFAERFALLGSTDDPSQAIERIWDWPSTPPALYPEDTALRRGAKRHLLAGGLFGKGFGLLKETRA